MEFDRSQSCTSSPVPQEPKVSVWGKTCSSKIVHNKRYFRSSRKSNVPGANNAWSSHQVEMGSSVCKSNQSDLPTSVSASVTVLSDIQSYIFCSKDKISDQWLHQLLNMLCNFIDIEKKNYISSNTEEGRMIGYNHSSYIKRSNIKSLDQQSGQQMVLLDNSCGKQSSNTEAKTNHAYVMGGDPLVSSCTAIKMLENIGTQTELLREFAKRSVTTDRCTQTWVRLNRDAAVQCEESKPLLSNISNSNYILSIPDSSHSINKDGKEVVSHIDYSMEPIGINHSGDDDGESRVGSGENWREYGVMQQHHQMRTSSSDGVCWIMENRQHEVLGGQFNNSSSSNFTKNVHHHHNNGNHDEIQVEYNSNKSSQMYLQSSSYHQRPCNFNGFASDHVINLPEASNSDSNENCASAHDTRNTVRNHHQHYPSNNHHLISSSQYQSHSTEHPRKLSYQLHSSNADYHPSEPLNASPTSTLVKNCSPSVLRKAESAAGTSSVKYASAQTQADVEKRSKRSNVSRLFRFISRRRKNTHQQTNSGTP